MNNYNQLKIDKFILLVCVLCLVKLSAASSDEEDAIEDATSIWSRCESHRQCKKIKYSQCNGGKCRCIPNYDDILDYNECKGNVNATCDSDYDCKNHQEVGCISNICQSYATFFTPSNYEQIKLWRATRIGSGCETDENCSDLQNTVCKSKKCDCASYYWKDDSEICRPVTNATCSDDSDCKESGTKCFLERCILPTDFFVESNALNTSLYAAKKIDDICQTDHHCRNLDHSQCKDGACICAHGSRRYSTRLIEKCERIVNDSCNKDYHCVDNLGVRCILNTCLYPEDFFVPSNAHNISLYAATWFQGVCRTDHHCRNLENTHCVDGLCECHEDYAYMPRKCSKLSDLFCTHDSNCTQYHRKARCLSNACQFPKYYFNSATSSTYRTKWIGGYCKYSSHCKDLNHTTCRRNKCDCSYDYEYKSGSCIRETPFKCSRHSDCRVLGESCFLGVCQKRDEFFGSSSSETLELYATDYVFGSCQTDHHCRKLNNTGCFDGLCTCLPDSQFISRSCEKTLNVTCSDDSDCATTKIRCLLNTCLYPDDFFVPWNSDKVNLYAAKRMYGDCRSDHHCRNLKNTYCYQDSCNCLPGYEYVNGSCQMAIYVFCKDDSDCLLPRSYCFLNTCLYPEDFLAPSNGYNTSLYAAKRIDGFCQTDQHCREIKDSKCFRRKCTSTNSDFFNDAETYYHTILRI